mmetsp:Transcript_21197/g.67513  ORF Transcript_21197/g.67513 Transcript_21197/m.67513 type:complete len:88 (+) Transcript_21197:429-692(+)
MRDAREGAAAHTPRLSSEQPSTVSTHGGRAGGSGGGAGGDVAVQHPAHAVPQSKATSSQCCPMRCISKQVARPHIARHAGGAAWGGG